MTYISIDTDKKQAQQFLEYVKTLPFVKIPDEPNAITIKGQVGKGISAQASHRTVPESLPSHGSSHLHKITNIPIQTKINPPLVAQCCLS